MQLWETIRADIENATGVKAALNQQGSVAGGCINQAMRVQYGDVDYFVKFNTASQVEMFEAEAQGLLELRNSKTLRVPDPVCWGDDGHSAYLVMENLQMGGRADPVALGAGLASLHRVTRDRFGWFRNNTIGATLQVNTESGDWIDFWREQRLQFQLELAASHGHGGRLQSQGERLLDVFPRLFESYTPQVSLLHGDLWGGNYGYDREGEPVIFDPAVYFGDRETDLAMTELFGGFSSDFYAAYQDHFPLDGGYPVRKTLYNLYHVLNHLNMFGGGYGSQAVGMMDSLLAEL
ncbi:MAG: fructosamine kinase family protein [Gammaproteobacteria bacterium]|nr:fructosamine kinase family protein [Gammaproteobacteria bacterium]